LDPSFYNLPKTLIAFSAELIVCGLLMKWVESASKPRADGRLALHIVDIIPRPMPAISPDNGKGVFWSMTEQ
jgi:hypothetical protein